jgi:hypothetical protein
MSGVFSFYIQLSSYALLVLDLKPHAKSKPSLICALSVSVNALCLAAVYYPIPLLLMGILFLIYTSFFT